jgi:pSer/pThr/pTyr-binding forkhead associated (FHA) protein
MSKLICIAGPNLGDQWDVPFGTTSIGRHQSNAVVLHDPKVSRKHAVLKFEADKYTIEDTESLNGTYIYGKKITHAVITPETPIRIGNSTLLFTRKHLHEIGAEYMESVSEDLLLKHKSKEAVMSEILHDLERAKAKQAEKKEGVFGKLLSASSKPDLPPKKKGLGMSQGKKSKP